jgi:hypothetical protein
MALYTMTKDKISSIPETDLTTEGFTERGDLQRLLRGDPRVIEDAIGSELRVIAEEFGDWDNANRRIDLLAVDQDANLVVIELKRADAAHMELQAIRYAAMVAKMTFEQVAEKYSKLLNKTQIEAQAALQKFFGWSEPFDDAFGREVRIVLVAAEFNAEITSTVLWLNEYDLDIRCVRLKTYKLDEKLVLDFQQIIPLPELEGVIIQNQKKKQEKREASRAHRGDRALDILVARGLLKPGDRLQLVRPPRQTVVNITDEKARHATFENPGIKGIKWDFDQGNYSLGSLTKKLCESFGGGTIDNLRGPLYWGIEGQNVSLAELAGPPPPGQGGASAQ